MRDLNKYLSKKFNREFLFDFNSHNIKFEHIELATEAEVLAIVNMEDSDNSYSWDKDVRFLKLAREIATWSKDPSSKIGAIAVSENNSVILSQGYNGFPRGIKDDYRLHIRPVKYSMIVHAEMNMIFNASMNGVNLKDSTIYVYGLNVCPECAKGIIQVGAKRVVMGLPYSKTESVAKYKKLFDEVTSRMFDEVDINYTTTTLAD